MPYCYRFLLQFFFLFKKMKLNSKKKLRCNVTSSQQGSNQEQTLFLTDLKKKKKRNNKARWTPSNILTFCSKLKKKKKRKMNSFVVRGNYISTWSDQKMREKVTTTNFATSKTKKNIEKFANHHYIESHFVVIFFDAIGKIRTSKVWFLS